MANKFLIDTCTFYWSTFATKLIPEHTKKIILESENEIYISSISVWELLIKRTWTKSLAGINFTELKNNRIKQGFQSISLKENDLKLVEKLPKIHKDPFDRILIAQALNHNMTILTPDKKIHAYPVRTTWDNC